MLVFSLLLPEEMVTGWHPSGDNFGLVKMANIQA